MLTDEIRQLCDLFAGLLDYPDQSLARRSLDCAGLLEDAFPGHGRPVQEFAAFAEGESRGTLEELYTETFDMSQAASLYIGFHCFGESDKRSAFLVRLEEAYRAEGFSRGGELPDHLCVILRFLSVARDSEFVMPLVEESLLPALDKIEEALHNDKSSYEPVARSLKSILERSCQKSAKTGRVHA